MAVSARGGHFARPAAHTTDTVVTGLGFQPHTIVFILSHATAVNTWRAETQAGIVVVSNRYQNSIATGAGVVLESNDASAIPSTILSIVTAPMLIHMSGADGGQPAFTADTVTYDSDGFTINWRAEASYDGEAELIGYLALGGDVQSYYAPLSLPEASATIAAGTIITRQLNLPFEPTGMVIAASILGGLTSDYQYAATWGVRDSYGKAWSTSFASNEDTDPQPNYRRLTIGRPLEMINANDGSSLGGFEVVTLNRKELTLRAVGDISSVWPDGNFALQSVFFGGVILDAPVFAKSTGATPATQDVATKGQPIAALFASVAHTANDTTVNQIRGSFGVSDGSDHRAVAWQIEHNVGTSNSDTWFSHTSSIVKADNATPTVEANASLDAFGDDKITLIWNLNDAVATQVAALTFGTLNKFEASLAAQSRLEPSRAASPMPLSGTMYAASDIIYAVFGNTGNMPTVAPMIAGTTLTVPGIRFDHAFTAEMTALTIIGSLNTIGGPGLGMIRPLDASLASQSFLLPYKAGVPAPFRNTVLLGHSTFSPLGLRLDHNLLAAMRGLTSFETYFQIFLPIVRDALPTELAGTINWHPNPSVEKGTFAYTSVNNATLTQSTAHAWDGLFSLLVDTPGAVLGEGASIRGIAGLELTGKARTVWGQARIRGPAFDLQMWTRLTYRDGSVDGDATTFHAGSDWELHYAPAIVTDPSRLLIRAETIVASTFAASRIFSIDGAQIEEDRGQGPTAWVTGDYGKATGTWLGVPHLSMSMREPLPLTITGTGRGGDIEITATMYRATWDNQWLEDISDAVIKANVSMDPERETTWTLDAELTREGYERLEPNLDWLAPVLTVRYPDGTVKSGQLGLYLLVPSEQERGEYDGTVTISAFDPLWLVARQAFIGPLVTLANVPRIQVVRAILEGAVLTGGDTPGTARRFAIETDATRIFRRRHEWPRDTDRLSVCNQILEGMNFFPLYTTATGFITSRWRGPADARIKHQTPVRAWAANLPEGIDVGPWIPRLTSLRSEVVGRIQTIPRAHDMFDEILLINDDPRLPRIFVKGKIVGGRKKKDDHDRDHRGNRRDRHDERRDERRDNRDDRDRRQRERRHERRQQFHEREREIGSPRVVYQDHGRRRVKRVYAPFVDDEATAREVAAALTDQLAAYTETVRINVLPDPSVDYARNTVLLAIWDGHGEPVAVGQYLVRRVDFGFTPRDCVQEMELDLVDNVASELVVG